MKQGIKKGKSKGNTSKSNKKPSRRAVSSKVVSIYHKGIKCNKKKQHPKYGTSKLEQDFAKDFLDKLGINYIYQFEAKDIGRFYDFYLPDSNLLIEIDGSYHHSDPRIVKEENMNPMQKKNKRVDELKNKWALLHSIPLMRIWEYDIRNNPSKVMEDLKNRLYIEDKKVELKRNKQRRKKINKDIDNNNHGEKK